MSDDKQIVKDFFHYVNMTAEELKEWLDNPTSMNTGQAAEDGEPKGAQPALCVMCRTSVTVQTASILLFSNV